MKGKPNFIHHLLFWIVFTATFTISEWNIYNTFTKAITFELLVFPARFIMVYICWFILIPAFLYKNKPWKFTFFFFGILILISFSQRVFLQNYGYPIFIPEWANIGAENLLNVSRIVQNATIIVIPVAFVSGWKLYSDFKQKQELAKELEQQKTETELKYLKSQINPHFLFNTLNNIYGLSLENSKKVPDLILKLSDFLSFSLYETTEKFVPLEKEVQLIKNFIELQTSRFEDRVKVNLELPMLISTDIFVPPMIFIPFVENAFKHSLMNETEMAVIKIDISVEKNKVILKVNNSKQSFIKSSFEKGGIGLTNIKRRLDLLYGKNYTLDINDTVASFDIYLVINN